MSKATVYAVMRATIEIPVRASSSEETLAEMHKASMREAEDILRRELPSGIHLVGQVEFSHAIVKGEKS